MKNSWILLVSTLVVGALGGYVIGSNSGSSTTAIEKGQDQIRTRSTNRGDSGTAVDAGSHGKRSVKSLDEIQKIPGTSGRLQAMIDYYEKMTASQMEDAARALDDMPLSERMMASFLLFGRWGEVDPTAAMNYANTMGFGGMMVRPAVLQSWASVDPANAAKYFSANPREFAMMSMGRGFGGQDGASIIAGEWAKQDPTAALAWANSLTQGKSDALSAVMREMAKNDPAKAAQTLAGMSAADSGNAYRTVAEYYGASNFADAQTWIQSLPADQKAEAMASAITGLAKSNPQEAAKQIAMLEDSDAKSRAVSSIVGLMARDNPQAAAAFLTANGNESAQSESMRNLIPAWVAKDPNAALNYASALPAGGTRDSALQTYVWSNRTSAPSELMQVAEQIGDERDRSRVVGMTAGRWMQEDPVAAKAYIQQSTTISDGMKENLLNGGSAWGGWGGRGRGRN